MPKEKSKTQFYRLKYINVQTGKSQGVCHAGPVSKKFADDFVHHYGVCGKTLTVVAEKIQGVEQ